MSTFRNLMMSSDKVYINLEIIGSPTIYNNVISGFSTSKYVQVDKSYRLDNSEYYIKFTTGSSSASGGLAENIIHSEYWIGLYLLNNDLCVWNFSSQTEEHMITLSQYTTYWVKIKCNGNKRTIYLSTNGNTYTQIFNYTDSLLDINENYPIRFGARSTDGLRPFYGSIDFNETFIISGKTQYIIEVPNIINITIIGNPTINNGVVSNFSTSNYLTFNNLNLTDFEIYFKFNMSSSGSNSIVFNFGTSDESSRICCQVNADRTLWCIIRPNGTSDQLSVTTTSSINLNTDYYIKYTFINKYATVLLSSDNINWTLIGNSQLNTSFQLMSYNYIGSRYLGTDRYFRGSIDLNQNSSYIIINGKKYIYSLP